MSTKVSVLIVNTPELEKQSGLSFGHLQLIKQQAGHFAYSQYAAYLYVLVHGPTSLGIKIQDKKSGTSTLIDETLIKKVHQLQSANPTLNQVLKRTPAGTNGLFKISGDVGVSCGLNSYNQTSHLVYGEVHYLPPLLQHALQKISYSFFDKTAAYMQQIRAKAFLATPKSVYGSVEQVAAVLSNITTTFEKLILDIYKGAIRAIQTFVSYLNGLASQLQSFINNIVEQIIPADFMCLILQVLQFIVKDISFFTTIFANVTAITNIQGYLNQYLQQVEVIGITSLFANLTPEVQNILNIIHNFNINPKAYVAGSIRNLVYASTIQALQEEFCKVAANRYKGNLSYAGTYSSTLFPDLMRSMSREIIQSDSGLYNQIGRGYTDTQQTNRYGEKSIQIPTNFYHI